MSDTYYVVQPPSGFAVSLAEAKKHCRIDDYQAGAAASNTFGTSNSKLVLTAKIEGISANSWEAEIVKAGNSTPLSVSYDAGLFTINLATDSGGTAISTVNDVIAALLNEPTIANKISATSGDGNGTDLLAEASAASFSGGVDGVSYEDDYVTGLILVAQERSETILRKKILTQTIVKIESRFPCGRECLDLDWGNVQSVEAVRYYDKNGDLTELESPYDLFEVETRSTPAKLSLVPGESWPSVQYQKSNPLEVEYIVGWDVEDVPVSIKHAMKLMIGHWYTNRESVQIGPGITSIEVPQAAEWLLWPLRDFRF